MARTIDLLTSRWCISFFGVALLAGVAWAFLPLFPGFDDWPPRIAVVIALLMAWAGANALLDLRRLQHEAALAKGIAAGAERAEEAQALRERLTAALDLLKRSSRSRGYLYEHPWYAIIGPPGAGKTTALLNAGLRFPLAEQMGQGAIAGVGGTRLCDWWFTEDAVLIDTAGRYTTQDSNADVDRAGWDAFLNLLKQTRSKQPLNGLIIAFPIAEIANGRAAERKAHAEAIRSRIEELQTRFGIHMPVYLLFTKVDLIAGFTEFFDDLDREQRAQVWGTTFDLTDGRDSVVELFASELRALIEQLNARLFDRMQAERDVERRARIAMFPGQMSSLEGLLADFLHMVFDEKRDGSTRQLRGVYFTSGTQEGTPFDRLTGTLARALGVDQSSAQSLRPVQGRSYFLERLLKEVIFAEAWLVAHTPAATRRRFALRIAGYAAAALLVIAAGTALLGAHLAGQRAIEASSAALARYEQTARGLTLDPIAGDDLARLVPLLDQARALPGGDGEPSWLPPLLSQRSKLNASAQTVYRHALQFALLPRLMWRLETQLRSNLSREDFLYEATRVYLMLGNAGPLDVPLVSAWMKLDWETAYPGVGYAPLRDSLQLHLSALLAEPLPQMQLDGALLSQVRARIATVPLAQRVYSRIRPFAAAQGVPPWRPGDVLGVAGAALFVRSSGKPLTDGIAGFYTTEGFHKVLLPSLDRAVKGVVSESWVLGSRVVFDANGPQLPALEREVIGLYETDYAQAWDRMLADLNPVQLRSLPQAAQDLYILASPESPMRSLLASIARQLTLSAMPGDARSGNAAQTSAANDTQARLQAIIGSVQAATNAPLPPGHEIDERYQALREFVGTRPGAPIDSVLREIGDAQQVVAKLAATLVSAATATPANGALDPLLTLKTDAARQPEPVQRWLSQIAASVIALRSGDPRLQLATIYNAPGGPSNICPAVVNGHYPFVATSADDISIADFARLFAPGAALDGFTNTLLGRYVDTSARTWHLISADAASSPISAADVAQFQRAATIRDTYFADGETRPHFRLDITPVSADAATRRATLDLDGTAVVYTSGEQRTTRIMWPTFSLQPTMRLVFDPPAAGSEAVQAVGPWAMFRLFGRGRMQPQPAAPDHYALTFQLGARQAVFDLRVPGGSNPLALGLLQDFRCPSVRGN